MLQRSKTSPQGSIKTAEEVEKMRVAGRLTAMVLKMIGPHVKAGVTTDELDRICHDYIVNDLQGIPAPLHYQPSPEYPPFPKLTRYRRGISRFVHAYTRVRLVAQPEAGIEGIEAGCRSVPTTWLRATGPRGP